MIFVKMKQYQWSVLRKDANLENKVSGSWNDPIHEVCSLSHYRFYDPFQKFEEHLFTKTILNGLFCKLLTLQCLMSTDYLTDLELSAAGMFM